MDTGEWRDHMPADSREKVVNKMIETLQKQFSFSVPEGINELRRIATRFEDKIFTTAIDQNDYFRKISLKMLTLETKSQNADDSSTSVQNQGQTLPLSSNQSQAPKQPLAQNIQNNMASGIPASTALPASTLPECSLTRKVKRKLIGKAKLFEDEFGNLHVNVNGREVKSSQQDQRIWDSKEDGDQNDELDFDFDFDMPLQMEETQTTSTRLRPSQKRKADLMIARDEYTSRSTAFLTLKNDILEEISKEHPDYKCSVTCAVQVLNELPGVTKWSPFFSASMEHLMACSGYRQAFLAFSTPKDKIRYLEYMTRKSHNR